MILSIDNISLKFRSRTLTNKNKSLNGTWEITLTLMAFTQIPAEIHTMNHLMWLITSAKCTQRSIYRPEQEQNPSWCWPTTGNLPSLHKSSSLRFHTVTGIHTTRVNATSEKNAPLYPWSDAQHCRDLIKPSKHCKTYPSKKMHNKSWNAGNLSLGTHFPVAYNLWLWQHLSLIVLPETQPINTAFTFQAWSRILLPLSVFSGLAVRCVVESVI